MKFSKLKLRRDIITDTIADEYEGVKISSAKNQNQSNLTIEMEGKVPATLILYYNKDGTTTIVTTSGKNKEFSLEVAKVIVKKCTINEIRTNSCYFKSIRKEDFDIILKYLSDEYQAEILSPTNINYGKQYKIKGVQGDTLNFNYWDKGALQIQGKPLLLFSQSLEILSELLPFKEVIQQQLEYYFYSIKTEIVIEELENRIPVSFSHLDDKIKAILTPAMVLRKTDLELQDYSCYAYPVLRALEGVIKQFFRDQGTIIQREGFGAYIKPTNTGTGYELTSSARTIISCSKKEMFIIDMYSFYYTNRHGLFHTDGLISTTRILTKPEAESIINDVLDIIETGYKSL